ncbi:ABC transporter permease [Agrobacterium sp. fls2-241-TYG-188a]|uniref:FtsX-like permease family protein n=1 Tax=Agrobacterium sp. fls2-241-TYG-188a TaxID=3040275 RepID=UPI00254FFFAA|nr:ABC transporter permease [Agrobacterium sp. fls2-241-TYG-188a]
MNVAAFFVLLSHWRHRPIQLATLVLGIALATALWSGVQAINAEARGSYARSAALLEQSGLEQLVAKDADTIALKTYAALRRAGWNVSPVIEGDYRLGGQRLRLIGIDPLTMPPEGRVVSISGSSDLADFIGGMDVLVVSPATAKRLEGEKNLRLRVSDVIPDDAAFTDIAVADRLLKRGGALTRLVVAPDQRVDPPALERIAPDLRIKAAGEQPDLARLTDSFHLNLTAFGFLAFVVGLFIVYSATGLSYEQRRATFRTVRSLGLSLRALTSMLLIEILALGVLSGLLGIVIGYFMASLLLPGVAATLRGLYGASISGGLALRPEWWLAGLGMAVAGTLLSAIQSLWRVRKMPILASSQPRAWMRASGKGLRVQAGIGAFLLVLALGLAIAGSGLVAGFAVLAALLLGSALILPVLLSVGLTLAQRLSSRALTFWFWADTRMQLPGLSLALMALLLALSANIGVGTMVSSFRYTFLGWLDQRLVSELYVTARDETEAVRLAEWLKPRADAMLPSMSMSAKVLGSDVQLSGVADHPTYREHWPLLQSTPDAWDAVSQGRGALVNEQFWRRNGVKIGQDLTLPGSWTVKIVGIYSDYGNPEGQLMIGAEPMKTHFPDVPILRYGVRIDPAQAPALAGQLTSEFGLPRANIIDQSALKQQSRAIFEQTFVVTGALNVLTLAVAAFAMFASLLTLSGIRIAQLAPVWAMGVRRRDLAMMEVFKTVALWFVTFLAAIPVGLALAWVLLVIVNVEAFGWRLPVMVFPLEWAKLGAIALIAAILSVLLPVLRLANSKPADLVRVFANER